MDDLLMNRLLMKKTEKKFYGHDKLVSKYTPQIPLSAEREYIRLTNAYVGLLKEALEEELPKLKEVYKANRDEAVRENQRNDSAADLMLAITQTFNRIKAKVVQRAGMFELRRKMEILANLNRKLTVKEWKKAIKATLGVDILEDYYLGDFYIEQLREWVEYNVGLISTIPEETLEDMRRMVYDGYTKGVTGTSMVKRLQRRYQISKRHARLIARDQTAKLSGQIQRFQQMDAGIKEYEWSDSGDSRVRPGHRKLNGHIFSWNDPPVVDERTGRRCHPCEDYQCRCVGEPVFNREMLLPLAGDDVSVTLIVKEGKKK